MSDVVTVIFAFALMEPVTYLAHRYVMHGIGRALHNSHHQARAERFEKNDLFPVIFAAITILAMAAGNSIPGLRPMFVVGIGVTLYGFAYMFVHDVYIHRRLPFFKAVWRPLEHLKEAHRIHHLYGAEPYGMLCPVVRQELWAKAARVDRDPFARTVTPSPTPVPVSTSTSSS